MLPTKRLKPRQHLLFPVDELGRAAGQHLPEDGAAASSIEVNASRLRREQLETLFLQELPHLSPVQAEPLWLELAGVYGQLQNHADAALCWLNALWQQPQHPVAWAWGWLRAEAIQARWQPRAGDLGRLLDLPATPERTRTLAAFVVWTTLQDDFPTELLNHLEAVQIYLDTEEAHLPIRAAWLVKNSPGAHDAGRCTGPGAFPRSVVWNAYE